MDQRAKSTVELLSSNRDAIAKEFKARGPVDVTLAALVWTLAGRRVNAVEMRASYDYFNKSTSAFSSARSKNVLALVSRMTMSGNSEAYYAEVQRIYDKIKEGKKVGTSARFGTALLIANVTQTPEEADQLLERTQKIFDGMLEAHPLITDDKSMPFAAIIALTGRDEEELLANADECYKLLGKGYGIGGGRKNISYILATSPLPAAQKVARLEDLRKSFKAHKIPLGWSSMQEFAVLAMLALDDRPTDDIAANVAEIDALIKKQKGFGGLMLDRAFRLLYASVISTYAHQDAATVDAVASNLAVTVAEALFDWFMFGVVVAAAQ